MVSSVVEKLNPTRVKLTITATPEDLKPSIDHAYEHIAEQVNIPGFRKGKVPAPIIDKRVGRAEVIRHAVSEGLDGLYRIALEEHGLRPISQPEADVVQVPEEKDFSGDLIVEVEVEVRPEFDLPSLDKIKLTVADVTADDAEIDEELTNLRNRFASFEDVDRAATKGDQVTIDLVAEIDGKQVDAAEGVPYELGSGELIEGIDEALDSLTVGEDTTFESTLLGGEHEGKKAQVTVTVTALKEKKLPEADDDFAQLASPFDTVAELREDLKEQVLRSKKLTQYTEARNKLIELLLEKADVPVSEKIIGDEVHRHLEQEGRLEDDAHRAEVTEDSTKRLRQQFLLDKFVDAEEIQVGQQDLSSYIVQAASQYQMDPNEFVKVIEEQGQIPAIVADLGRSKAISTLLTKVEVKSESGEKLDFSEFLSPDNGGDALPVDTGDDHEGHNH